MDIVKLNSVINNNFNSPKEIKDSVIRATKKWNDGDYQIHYFDFSEKILNKDLSFEDYQRDLLLEDYYSIDSSLQWNFYLHILLEDDKVEELDVDDKILSIEHNKKLARKNIYTESEFYDSFKKKTDIPKEKIKDLVDVWKEGLPESLHEIFNERSAVNRIVDSYINEDEIDKYEISVSRDNEVEPFPFIQNLHIEKFREFPRVKTYEFGLVNLIHGPNAVGKTSLLESIELMVCGKTLRNSDKRTPFKFDVVDFDGNQKTFSSSDTSDKLYRSRDYCWYGRTYTRGNNLNASFGRFNYFDTDAAALFTERLSIDEKSNDLNQAFTQVVFGPDTHNLFERIKRTNEKSLEKARIIKNNFDSSKRILNEYQKELETINKTDIKRKSTDAIHEAFIKWKVSEKYLSNDFFEELIGDIEKAKISLASWKDARYYNVNKYKDFDIKIKFYKEVANKISEFEKKLENIYTKETDIEITRKRNNIVIIDLHRVKEYVKSGAVELFSIDDKVLNLREVILSISSSIEIFKNVDKELIKEFLDFPIFKANDLMLVETEENNRKIQSLNKKLDKIKSRLDEAKVITSEIRNLAVRFVKIEPDSNECPVCMTIFNNENLSDRFKLHTDMLSSAHLEINELLEEHTLLSKEKENLQKINKSLSYLNDAYFKIRLNTDDHTTIKLIIDNLSSIFDVHNERKDELDTLLIKKDSYIKDGFSVGEIRKLLDKYSYSHDSPMLSESINSDLNDLSDKNENTKKILLELTTNKLAIESELVRFKSENIGNIEQSDSNSVYGAASIIESYLSDVNYVNTIFYMEPEFSEKKISDTLNKISEYALDYLKYKEISSREKDLNKNINKANENISLNEKKLERANQLNHYLDKIINKKSPSILLAEFIEIYKKSISEVFYKIHSPQEFDKINISDNKIILYKKHSNTPTKLTELSTGQRSALVLSVFLTMNKALSNGPKLLLFDDPIAYVDDLNILSFFDYIQDISLKNERQIFFATASDKIATLFEKKFDFLNSEQNRFNSIKLSR